MDFNAAVSAQIRAECARVGISGAELARRTGIPTVTMNRYLTTNLEKLREINVEVLATIAAALGTTAWEILAEAQRHTGSTSPAASAPHATTVTERDISAGAPLPQGVRRTRKTPTSGTKRPAHRRSDTI